MASPRWLIAILAMGCGCAHLYNDDGADPAAVTSAQLAAVPASNRWGFNDDSGIAGGVNGPIAPRLAREAGMGWTRYWLYWDVAQPGPNQYNWAVSDRALADLIDAGMNVYVTIMWAPPWATGGLETYVPWRCMDPATSLFDPNRVGGACRDSRPDVAAFRSFVRAAIQRYRGRYGDRVKHWGFWNETAYGVFWHSSQRVADNIFIPGYDEAKATDPGVIVVGPEANVVGELSDLLSYESRTRRFFDILSIHVYGAGDDPGNTLSLLDNAFAPVVNAYRAGRPVWLTEFGVASVPADPGAASRMSVLIQNLVQRPQYDRFIMYRLRGGTGVDYSLVRDDLDVPKTTYDAVAGVLCPARNCGAPASRPGLSTSAMVSVNAEDSLADFGDLHVPSGQFWIHVNTNGGFGGNMAFGVTTTGPDWKILLGDFNGDGAGDYAELHVPSGNIYVHRNRRDGSFTGPNEDWGFGTTRAGAGWEVMAGDFDGDGFADIAEHHLLTGHLFIKRNIHEGGAGICRPLGGECFFYIVPRIHPGDSPGPQAQTMAGPDWTLKIADFNGDNRSDYADVHIPSGQIWIHRNLGSHAFTPQGGSDGQLTVPGGDGVRIMTGDLIGNDRRADIAVLDRSTNHFVIYQNTQPNPALPSSFTPGSVGAGQASPPPVWDILGQ